MSHVVWARFCYPWVPLPLTPSPACAVTSSHPPASRVAVFVVVVVEVVTAVAVSEDLGRVMLMYKQTTGTVTNVTVGFIKPVTRNFENPYPYCGYGFSRVRARVALGNPRVARDNP
jgi:hypothetical protein